ncbi:MAG: alginate lyase family protein [Bacteroidota bacterium]
MESFQRYWNTVRYLKARQIFYQLRHRLIRRNWNVDVNSTGAVPVFPLRLSSSVASPVSFHGENKFTFLNRTQEFKENIQWNFHDHGKLWTYNLNYFDFLNQPGISQPDALKLITSFCDYHLNARDGREPYPISLRGINWIKFLSTNNISNARFNDVLKADYDYLADHPEYHLLGNHLLENGFSLLIGAYYFHNDKYYQAAKSILIAELDEQILADGAHFELSPMYHQVLLYRLLDCINVVTNNPWKDDDLSMLLVTKAGEMLGWLSAVTFSDGSIPMVNDSIYGIAPTTTELLRYAERLKLNKLESPLRESGYRMIRTTKYELFIDAGQIGPDYIPGHAHSDTFNFILFAKGKPIVIEVGTSTYETGSRRLMERSAKSHNTVVIDNRNQSDVWASFRVGRRAHIISISENDSSISAEHDGYRRIGAIHQRKWTWSDNEIVIEDNVLSERADHDLKAYLHFDPSCRVELTGDVISAPGLRISFDAGTEVELMEYEAANSYNVLEKGKLVELTFRQRLQTKILLT